MRKTVAVIAVIISIVSMFLAGCADNERAGILEMNRLQNDTGAFQFYDLEWESSPDMAQNILGITFEQPDTAGGFQIYRAENVYTWHNVTTSITCEYESDKLYAVTLRFMPQETDIEEFWSAMQKELSDLYGTVEGNIQTSNSEKLNITTENEYYLWEDQNGGDTLMSASKFSANEEFKYIALSVYVIRSERKDENTADSSVTSNLFQYAIEIEDGVFSPREVDFFMSTEEVLQATGLNEYTVFDKDGGKLIRANTNISGFSDNIIMDYVFDDAIGNLLVTIRYVFEVDEAEAADIYNLLYEQAVSVMPEASGNTIEGIKDGIDVSWEDKEQNYVRLWFFNEGNSRPGAETIMLQIQATRNSSFISEELKSLYENSLLRQ